MSKKIKNYVLKFYINTIVNDKNLDKKNSSNLMITAYFRTQLNHIKTKDYEAKRKFFFSFREKYLSEFKRYRKYHTTCISNFRNRTAFKEFKSSFTPKEWDRINGEQLSKYLALHNDSIKKVDFEFLKNILKITNKVSK